jgi:ATP:corrinoid adenosyltransferase
MADETQASAEAKAHPTNPDEIALELMKFIAVTTGYGKGTPTAGFGGKSPRTSDEYAEALLELFARCRTAVRTDPK